MGNWKKCTIADLGTVVGGATPSTKKPENYDGGTIAWITPKDLAGFLGRFISHGERNITEAGLHSCSTQMMPRHTILFSSRAPIGYVAIAENEVCTNQGFKSVVPNDNTDYMFLYYLLLNNRQNIEHMGSGTTFKEVSGKTMRGIEVCVPESKEEQIRISSMLSAIDDKIEENERINKNLESQAFSYFDYLQGITLNTCTIKYIAELNPTRTIKKGTIARYIGMSDLSTSISFPESWSYAQYKGGAKFVNGDTILARITPCLENGKTAYIGLLNPDEAAFGSTEYIVLSPKDGIPAPFLYCLARNKKFREFAIKNMTGTSGRQRVSATAISSFELKLPSKNQLQQFGSFTTTAFKIITNNGLENQKLAMLRDTLLPKLMSGELDVSDLDL